MRTSSCGPRESTRLAEQSEDAVLSDLKEDWQFGEAVRRNSGVGALDYVLDRHRRVWSENASRVDSLIRHEVFRLEGRRLTPTQQRRLFSEGLPTLIKDLANAEAIEIDMGLSAERLAPILFT